MQMLLRSCVHPPLMPLAWMALLWYTSMLLFAFPDAAHSALPVGPPCLRRSLHPPNLLSFLSEQLVYRDQVPLLADVIGAGMRSITDQVCMGGALQVCTGGAARCQPYVVSSGQGGC